MRDNIENVASGHDAGSKKVVTPVRQFDVVVKILENYHYDHEKLIPILHEVQEEYRYLPEAVLMYVANSLGISPARVYGVATFYTHFALQPKGKYVVRVCDGTACHVKGSMNMFETIKKVLSLSNGKSTTDDLMFTIETVSCLGACGLAPVMMVNSDVYGQLTEDKVKDIIENIRKSEAGVK
ncbi:MAG: NADH-quinone oxidoreductase subunit NuoE [Desulfatiglans sp.]|nr:NADH-quinone oxidoreductase subunit NuoE [Desulfatiglans sp.]